MHPDRVLHSHANHNLCSVALQRFVRFDICNSMNSIVPWLATSGWCTNQPHSCFSTITYNVQAYHFCDWLRWSSRSFCTETSSGGKEHFKTTTIWGASDSFERVKLWGRAGWRRVCWSGVFRYRRLIRRTDTVTHRCHSCGQCGSSWCKSIPYFAYVLTSMPCFYLDRWPEGHNRVCRNVWIHVSQALVFQVWR